MEEIIINCMEDDKFERDRKIIHSCNGTFNLEKENIYYVETLGYFDDLIGQYYTICPNCGYMVLLDENELPDDIKLEAKKNYYEDIYQYKKNSLRSQLINLENKPKKVKIRMR